MNFSRHPNNPILRPNRANDEAAIYNPGAFQLDGTIFLVPRVRRASTRESHLTLAWSNDGYSFERLLHPVMFGTESYETPIPSRSRETGGIEDCRATLIDDRLYLTYTGYNRACHICLAWIELDLFRRLWRKSKTQATGLSHEWNSAWHRTGPVFPEMLEQDCGFTRNGCLFVHNGLYFLFYRRDYGDISLAVSLRPEGPWRDTARSIARSFSWERERIGISSPPVLLEDGSHLFLYHGVEERAPVPGADHSRTYHLGAFIARFSDSPPGLLTVLKMPRPILSPQEDYELDSDGWLYNEQVKVAAVFSCGMAGLGPGKEGLFVPYGTGDYQICAGILSGPPSLSNVSSSTTHRFTFRQPGE